MSRPCSVALMLILLAIVAPTPRVAATVPLRAGPYTVLVTIETAPLRAGRAFPLHLCPAPGGPPLEGASVTVIAVPVAGTAGATGTPIVLSADRDAPGCVISQLLLGAAGAWVLRVGVVGASGVGDAVLPLTVEESAPVPVWLGWTIGLTPLLGFGWLALWQHRRWRHLAPVIAHTRTSR